MARDFLNTQFGIEIEFTGMHRARAALVLAREFDKSSWEHISAYDARIITDDQGRRWKIVRDSSITPMGVMPGGCGDDYKCELVSPILTYREDIGTLQNIIRAFRRAGGKVNQRCGIHIHLNGGDHSVRSLKNFINIIAGHNDLLYEALQVKSERRSFCEALDIKLVEAIAKKKPQTMQQLEDIWYEGYTTRDDHYNDTRYHILNLHSFFHGHGTVELRAFNSTMHAGVVRSYIVLALALNHQALTAKCARAKTSRVQSDNPKFAMRTYLNRLGLIGDEFKACRKHLIKHLPGNAAWRWAV